VDVKMCSIEVKRELKVLEIAVREPMETSGSIMYFGTDY
jgi:hypothetical protein